MLTGRISYYGFISLVHQFMANNAHSVLPITKCQGLKIRISGNFVEPLLIIQGRLMMLTKPPFVLTLPYLSYNGVRL